MLSIIIVNFKNPPLLRLCLKSLARVLNTSCEIIVVDSQSTVETQNVILEEFQTVFASIKLVPFTKNIGYTRGVNEGIKASNGEYFLILNPDIVAIEGTVEDLLSYFQRNPSLGLLGPRLLNFDDSTQQSCFRFYTPLTILYRRIAHLPFARKILDPFLYRDRNLSTPQEVDWLMGSAIMASRKAVNAIGLMDEQFFLYMSEVDWAKRFWENGYAVVYYPVSALYHYHKRESKGSFGIFDAIFKRETRWHMKDAIRYFIKHGTRLKTSRRINKLPITA